MPGLGWLTDRCDIGRRQRRRSDGPSSSTGIRLPSKGWSGPGAQRCCACEGYVSDRAVARRSSKTPGWRCCADWAASGGGLRFVRGHSPSSSTGPETPVSGRDARSRSRLSGERSGLRRSLPTIFPATTPSPFRRVAVPRPAVGTGDTRRPASGPGAPRRGRRDDGPPAPPSTRDHDLPGRPRLYRARNVQTVRHEREQPAGLVASGPGAPPGRTPNLPA